MYKCENCGYESTKFFGLCPKCHEGIGKEIEDIVVAKTKNNPNGNPNIKLDIKKVDPNRKVQKACRKTQFDSFNNILSTSKGFIEGQVILLGASPGIGKSTLCISIAQADTLYISSEENFDQVNNRALRVNNGESRDIQILNSTSIDEILAAIEQTECKFIIIDSLNSIEFGVGYLTVAKYANAITNLIKKLNKICIIISQVSRTGEISGMNAIIHIVDTVLYLERAEISSNIIAVSTKNRFGEIGSIAIFRHENNGFKEISIETAPKEAEIGSTFTETQFGHKKMTISIEALVTTAQSSFGIKRSTGYNQNRLIQLIGLLSYYGKIDLSNKDIYVTISNGLFTDDINIELAMANSIISSYYKKAVVIQAYGEVRLSGKIINGNIDGRPINHISELFKIYK